MLDRPRQPACKKRCWKSPARRRRGVAVLLVLLLITMTLAVTYAAVRSQSMAYMVQRNSDRRATAQQVAVTGMRMALKKMQDSSWAGFGSTLNGTLSTSDTFTATYTFGDASLTSSSPDYNDYPFRGTITVTGKSVDPLNTQCVATYQITAVVHIVPRQLGAEPSDWNTMQQYMVYQTNSQPFEIDIPCQLSGPVRIQGALKIAPHYPDSPGSDSWVRYLADLYNMVHSGGYVDYRPFPGTVSYVSGAIDSTNLSGLITYLHTSVSTSALNQAKSDWTQPTGFNTYQLYSGGPTYSIPQVSNNLQSVTLGADPMTNPLGIFYYNGNTLTIRSNVTIKGSLFCKSNLTLDGSNINFQAADLPGMFGAGNSVRLPVIICNNLTVNNTVTSGSISGLVAVFNTLTISKAPQTQTIPIIGRVISKVFYIKERTPWDSASWSLYYTIWWTYYRYSIPYFPVYMNSGGIGLNYQPLLTINPDTTSITYHWPTPNAALFLVNSADGTLRWEVIKWTESP